MVRVPFCLDIRSHWIFSILDVSTAEVIFILKERRSGSLIEIYRMYLPHDSELLTWIRKLFV